MNKIESIIKGMETDILKFKPEKSFYKQINIGQKRFWQILRNEQQPTLDELERIAKALNVKPKDLIG